jgi:hypothetical protein
VVERGYYLGRMPPHYVESPVCAESRPRFLVGIISASCGTGHDLPSSYPPSVSTTASHSYHCSLLASSPAFTLIIQQVGQTSHGPRRRLASGTSGTHAWAAAKAYLGISSWFAAPFLILGFPSTMVNGATLAGQPTPLVVFLWGLKI